MKIYIAGPMTGYEGLNFPAFAEATKRLRDEGHEVISPAEVNPDLNADWVDCMIVDIKLLSTCDSILMLEGWENSYGARIEFMVAKKLELHIEFEEDKSD